MDIEAKKQVLRRLTNGLYCLGVQGPGRSPRLTLVSWLTQASVEPPMVAVAIRRETDTLDLVRWAGAFGVSVLPRGAERLAARLGCASSDSPGKLAGLDLVTGPALGTPLLAASLGWLECRVVDQLGAGDHVLFLAEVLEAGGVTADGEALTVAETGWRYGG